MTADDISLDRVWRELRESAIAASLALQYGCPLDVLRRALLRDPRGRASTPLGAALDLIAGGES